jgi:UDP-N-acetylglucosamine diphosphorylase/glucosamine-1-phosphate N-acetyltransferase
MRVCVFEDGGVSLLAPLTLSHPAFALWCGTGPLLERHRRAFAATDLGAIVRPSLAELCRRRHPGLAVNDAEWLRAGPAVLVNARWLPPDEPPATRAAAVGMADGQVAYVVAPSLPADDPSPAAVADLLSHGRQTLPAVEAGGRMLDYPWDLVEANPEALRQDFRRWSGSCERRLPAGVTVIGPPDQVLIDPSAEVEPLVLLDATKGPVMIDAGAGVQAFSRLEGPCYVGPGTRVLGGAVRGGTVGPHCRIGGEFEASVMQGYSNKAHEGFLGHSYVGEWVNFGAGTQVSDLRNDYETVVMTVAGRRVDTGRLKVGTFVGDHTKTGLCTLINTGTMIGAFGQVLPSDTFPPKEIPSFCSFTHSRLQERTDWRQLFGTAAKVLERRDRVWDETEADYFLRLFDETAPRRRQVIREHEQRRLRRIG